jgi:hypothetical protein
MSTDNESAGESDATPSGWAWDLAKEIARDIMRKGTGKGSSPCQRLQFMGGTWPNNEINQGGIAEKPLTEVIYQTITKFPARDALLAAWSELESELDAHCSDLKLSFGLEYASVIDWVADLTPRRGHPKARQYGEVWRGQGTTAAAAIYRALRAMRDELTPTAELSGGEAVRSDDLLVLLSRAADVIADMRGDDDPRTAIESDIAKVLSKTLVGDVS